MNRNGTPSVSSQVIDYMKTFDKDETFTSRQVADGMKLEDDGPVTGLMSRLKNLGIVKEVGRAGRASIYSLAGNIDDYAFKSKASIGGTAGRHTTGISRKQRFINTLFSLIEEVEKMKADLSDFTVKELLHEIEKRTNKTE